MDSIFPTVYSLCSDLPEENYSALRSAISMRAYPAIYRELRRYSHSFSPRAAFHLLDDALENKLTRKAFEEILKRAPPVPEILAADKTADSLLNVCGLLEKAAYIDRADVLSLLLERGACPNRTPGFDVSPLEAALSGQSLESVELLARQPELDTAWTDKLLREWAMPCDQYPIQEFCLQAIAPRFTGWEPAALQPLPIPAPMTARIIVQAQNWHLLERFCRERGLLSSEEGAGAMEVLGQEIMDCREEDLPDCAAGLASLLKSCPGLLRREKACRVLLRCFIKLDEEDRAELDPWVERLRHRRIAMERFDWLREGYDKLPERWRQVFPDGPTLVIDRWSDVLDIIWDGDLHMAALFGETSLSVANARRVLERCPVRGRGRPGKLSPVARALLEHGDAALIEFLFRRPGGLLATEDPSALLEYIQEPDCPRINRAAVLANVRKEENYVL